MVLDPLYLVELYACAVCIADGVEGVAVREAVGVAVAEPLPLSLLQVAPPVHQRRQCACAFFFRMTIYSIGTIEEG